VRNYLWGTCEIYNPKHCDIVQLQHLILGKGFRELKIETQAKHIRFRNEFRERMRQEEEKKKEVKQENVRKERELRIRKACNVAKLCLVFLIFCYFLMTAFQTYQELRELRGRVKVIDVEFEQLRDARASWEKKANSVLLLNQQLLEEKEVQERNLERISSELLKRKNELGNQRIYWEQKALGCTKTQGAFEERAKSCEEKILKCWC
jgi:septin family protein